MVHSPLLNDTPAGGILPPAKALNYALGRCLGLEAFLNDPEVAIDTNHLERAVVRRIQPRLAGTGGWRRSSMSRSFVM